MTMNLLMRCTDIGETRHFYSAVLGFEVADSAEGTCSVQKAGGTIIFTDQDLWFSPPKCTGTIYFFIPDVDAFHDTLKEKVSVSWPVQDMPYGLREFGIQDCNGYTLAFARTI